MRDFIVLMFGMCALSILVLGCDEKKVAQQREKAILTKQEILEIANEKAKSMDFPIGDSNVSYDEDNTKWKEHLVFLKEYLPNIAGRCDRALAGREYRTALYEPKSKTAMGGVLWIFVDPKSGKVIYVLPEM